MTVYISPNPGKISACEVVGAAHPGQNGGIALMCDTQ